MVKTILDNWKRLKQRVLYGTKKLEQRILCVRKESGLRAAGFLAGAFAFVWWCVLYPELCFPQDTYETVYETEEDNTESGEQEMLRPAEENFRGLLQAEEEQVIVKSRLLEWLERHKAE